MIIYRATKRNSDSSHDGYVYTASKRVAVRIHEENENEKLGDKVEIYSLKLNKIDVVDFLNAHCNYPDNG